MTKEQAANMAIHITDNYMKTVIARNPSISTRDFADEFIRNFQIIEDEVCKVYGISMTESQNEPTLNGFFK